DSENNRPPKIAPQYSHLSDNGAGEKNRGVAHARKHHEAEDKTEAGVPWRYRHTLIFVDEAHPFQRHVGCNDAGVDQAARQGRTNLRARRQRPRGHCAAEKANELTSPHFHTKGQRRLANAFWMTGHYSAMRARAMIALTSPLEKKIVMLPCEASND